MRLSYLYNANTYAGNLAYLYQNTNMLLQPVIFPAIGISIIKVMWSWDHLIFIMGMHMMVRLHIYMENGP